MVNVPERELVLELAATVNPTVPLPVPEAPESILIHVALLVAVQAQLPVDVMLTLPGLPLAPKFPLVWLRVKAWTVSVTGLEMSLPQEFETIRS